MIAVIKDLRINHKAREWCKLPYPLHPHGCPEYGARATCPPEAPPINEFFDLWQPLWLISVEFDLASHITKIKTNHPKWTDRQARCVLYWQNTVRKELNEQCKMFLRQHPEMVYTLIPEAMGVNVIATAQACGIPIKSRIEDKVFKIAFVGHPAQIPQGRFACLYDGIHFPQCSNNDKGICRTVYEYVPDYLRHPFDGKNTIKCPCG